MNHNDEQKALFLDYLDKHIFSYWRGEGGEQGYEAELELTVTPTCNTKCVYCYYNNFAEKYIYPKEINCTENIIKNCEEVMKWLQKNNYRPRAIEIFSGEFINLPYCQTILDIIDKYAAKGTEVVIPTNGTFCRSEKTLEKAQKLLDEYNPSCENHNIFIFYSLSVDGKYLDNDTRAMKSGTLYDDAFYDRLFTFAAKNHLLFHPMVGALGIDKWPNNYDWYIKNVMDYFHCDERAAFRKIYLLEVRNPDWTAGECEDMERFVNYLVDKTFKAYNNDVECYWENFLTGRNNFNFFSGLLSTCGRGLGCSIQQCFAVRLGDLALIPCHRTAYKGYNACYLRFDEDSNLDIEIENPNMYMFIQSFDAKNGVMCSDCPINSMCSHYCLGANYEVNKDFFIPVKSVCLMEYAKAKALVEAFDRIGVLPKVIELYSHSNNAESKLKLAQITNLIKVIKENR